MASCQLGRGPGLGSKPLCAQGFTTKSWMKNVEVSLHLLSTYLLTYLLTPSLPDAPISVLLPDLKMQKSIGS